MDCNVNCFTSEELSIYINDTKVTSNIGNKCISIASDGEPNIKKARNIVCVKNND